jgi:hypothetical protein
MDGLTLAMHFHAHAPEVQRSEPALENPYLRDLMQSDCLLLRQWFDELI